MPAAKPPHSRDRLLVTAGPTHEPIDDVRYIANRSSGRLGLALAGAAVERALPITLLLGPGVPDPQPATGLTCARFHTTEDLRAALARHWPEHDVLVMAAAVADFRPARPAAGGAKLSRSDGPLTLELEPTPDLLAELAAVTRPDQTVIGFALAPAERLADSARRKLATKRLDAIVANPLDTMGGERITATLHLADGTEHAAPPNVTKAEFARWLLDEVAGLRR